MKTEQSCKPKEDQFALSAKAFFVITLNDYKKHFLTQ